MNRGCTAQTRRSVDPGSPMDGGVPDEASASSPTPAPPVQRRLDSLVASIVEQIPQLPGLSVAAIDASGALVESAAGVADMATGEPLTSGHVMRIASSTKPFLAATVLHLRDRGEIELDTAAAEFLPAWIATPLDPDPAVDAITVRQLMQHTSGLDDHSSADRFLDRVTTDPYREFTPVEAIREGLSLPRIGVPGARFSYSDTGYIVLGQLIEHVWGRPLHEAVRSAARLDELAMSSTTWERFEPDRSPRAHQYLDGTDTFDWNPSFDLFGGGGLLSTPTDLCKFWAELSGDRDRFLDRPVATSPHGDPFPAGDRMGLGVFTGVLSDRPFIGHGGFWGTRELALIAEELTVAVFTTNRTAQLDTRQMVLEPILDVLTGPHI